MSQYIVRFDKAKKWYVLVVAIVFIISLFFIYSLLLAEYSGKPYNPKHRGTGIPAKCIRGNIELVDVIYIDGHIYLSVYNHGIYDLKKLGVQVTYNDTKSSPSFSVVCMLMKPR